MKKGRRWLAFLLALVLIASTMSSGSVTMVVNAETDEAVGEEAAEEELENEADSEDSDDEEAEEVDDSDDEEGAAEDEAETETEEEVNKESDGDNKDDADGSNDSAIATVAEDGDAESSFASGPIVINNDNIDNYQIITGTYTLDYASSESIAAITVESGTTGAITLSGVDVTVNGCEGKHLAGIYVEDGAEVTIVL
ncbi:MAG: hypothetical protein LUE24_02665 [Lachnospiraceae bacterium]|nr:hypothetical protein [Lachnospiraceae bacterium]